MEILRLLLLLERCGVEDIWQEAGHIITYASARRVKRCMRNSCRVELLIRNHKEHLLRHLRTAAQAGAPSLANEGGH